MKIFIGVMIVIVGIVVLLINEGDRVMKQGLDAETGNFHDWSELRPLTKMNAVSEIILFSREKYPKRFKRRAEEVVFCTDLFAEKKIKEGNGDKLIAPAIFSCNDSLVIHDGDDPGSATYPREDLRKEFFPQ